MRQKLLSPLSRGYDEYCAIVSHKAWPTPTIPLKWNGNNDFVFMTYNKILYFKVVGRSVDFYYPFERIIFLKRKCSFFLWHWFSGIFLRDKWSLNKTLARCYICIVVSRARKVKSVCFPRRKLYREHFPNWLAALRLGAGCGVI